MRRCLRVIALLVLAALPAGCGGDGDGGGPAGAGTTTTTRSATTPGARPAPQSERDRLSSCLTREGYRLQGGAGPAGADAPEYQIIFSGPRGGGYIGFYKNVSRAKRVATQLRTNAQRTSGAAVERHGAINILWVDLAGEDDRAAVRDCLVT